MHNISLTTEQYKALLKLVYLGEWIINAQDNDDPECDSLFEYIFSLTEKFGIPDVTMPDEPQYPTRQYEEEMNEYISEYNEETFWSELALRLAEKKLIEGYGLEQLQKMNKYERTTQLFKIVEKMDSYLQQHGLDEIHIDCD